MCIIGGGSGWMVIMVALPIFMLLQWIGTRRDRGRERESLDSKYPQYPPLQNQPPNGGGLQHWTCLNPRCRHRNMAGSHYCGRCGASRGFSCRVDRNESDDD